MKKICAFLAVALSFYSLAAAQSYSMSVLQNLPGVGINVRILGHYPEFGLTEDDLRAEAIKDLAENKIPYLDELKADQAPGSPVVEITVKLARLHSGSYMYSMDIGLTETVKLERKTAHLVSVPATTWTRGLLSVTSRPEYVVRAIGPLLQLFGKEYRQENGS